MTIKLTPMREFTLEMYEQLDCVHRFQDVVYKYAKFLGQKPTLGMFVPCDEEGNVLEEPDLTCKRPVSNGVCQCGEESVKYCRDLSYKYQQALSRVIFEGFELHFEYGKSWAVKGQGRVIRSFDLNTLEDLTHYNLTVKFEI
jgi:hypothetical protein